MHCITCCSTCTALHVVHIHPACSLSRTKNTQRHTAHPTHHHHTGNRMTFPSSSYPTPLTSFPSPSTSRATRLLGRGVSASSPMPPGAGPPRGSSSRARLVPPLLRGGPTMEEGPSRGISTLGGGRPLSSSWGSSSTAVVGLVVGGVLGMEWVCTFAVVGVYWLLQKHLHMCSYTNTYTKKKHTKNIYQKTMYQKNTSTNKTPPKKTSTKTTSTKKPHAPHEPHTELGLFRVILRKRHAAMCT